MIGLLMISVSLAFAGDYCFQHWPDAGCLSDSASCKGYDPLRPSVEAQGLVYEMTRLNLETKKGSSQQLGEDTCANLYSNDFGTGFDAGDYIATLKTTFAEYIEKCGDFNEKSITENLKLIWALGACRYAIEKWKSKNSK